MRFHTSGFSTRIFVHSELFGRVLRLLIIRVIESKGKKEVYYYRNMETFMTSFGGLGRPTMVYLRSIWAVNKLVGPNCGRLRFYKASVAIFLLANLV